MSRMAAYQRAKAALEAAQAASRLTLTLTLTLTLNLTLTLTLTLTRPIALNDDDCMLCSLQMRWVDPGKGAPMLWAVRMCLSTEADGECPGGVRTMREHIELGAETPDDLAPPVYGLRVWRLRPGFGRSRVRWEAEDKELALIADKAEGD